jgi:hypothetical protein
MNPLQNVSKWGWWLIGGLAMAGIGGSYAFLIQSQQRQVATPPSPSVPLPIQGVSPQFTDKPTAIKPAMKPTAKARKDPSQGVGGASQIPASELDGPAMTAMPRTGAAALMSPDDATDPRSQEIPAMVTRPNVIPAQPTALPARTTPARTSTAAVTKSQRATTPAKPAPAKSQPPAQQAKVIPPAAPAPAASDSSGQSAAGSTFVPEDRALFGTSPSAPNAQSYAAGNSNPLPPIEPAKIPPTTAPAPSVGSSAPDSNAAPAPDLPPESMPRPGN